MLHESYDREQSGPKRAIRWAARLLDSKSGALLVSFIFTLGIMYRYIFPLNALLHSGWLGNDCYQMTWNLWFANESITHGRNPYVTNLIYYPYGANLSHHTLAAGFFPVTFLVKLLTRGDAMYPIYAYKIIILLSFTLILYFSYLLLREINLSRGAAAIGAIAYAFCDFYMLHAQHINHLAGFFIPLAALFSVRFMKRPASSNALVVAVVSAAAVYFTEFSLFIYLAIFLFAALMCLFHAERQLLRDSLRLAGIRRVAVAFAVFVLIQAPFVINALRDRVVKPSYAESSHYSANLAGFFIPTAWATPLYGNIFDTLNSKITTGIRGFEVFLGFPLLVFAIVGLLKTRDRLIRLSAALGLIFLTLSLGPTLKVFGADTGFPLPYSLLMRIPPFDLGRTPVRFFVAAIFFLMIVSAWGIARAQESLARRHGWRMSSAVIALVFLWITAEAYSSFPKRQPYVPPRELEKIVGPVLNLPAYSNDGYAALLQTFHHQPIGTGYTARFTQPRQEEMRELRRAADRGGQFFCDRIREMGFRNIIINPTQVVSPYELGGVIPAGLSRCPINVVDLRDEAERVRTPAGEISEQPTNFPPYVVGTRIDLRTEMANKYLWYGWSAPEPESRWTSRGKAAIVFALSEGKSLVLRLQMGAFLVPGKLDEQRMDIALNGHQISTLSIRQLESREYSIVLPAEFLQEHNVLSFDLPNADSPASFALSEDERLLAINVQWIEVDAATRP